MGYTRTHFGASTCVHRTPTWAHGTYAQSISDRPSPIITRHNLKHKQPKTPRNTFHPSLRLFPSLGNLFFLFSLPIFSLHIDERTNERAKGGGELGWVGLSRLPKAKPGKLPSAARLYVSFVRFRTYTQCELFLRGAMAGRENRLLFRFVLFHLWC
ncbi:unnamed protein product [Periconia digitata]|uniref:Uncharacterized protein n=1 Tax=Periconia digitata TaxID=1303443 RepID=A0A9W4U0S5_9PLEO|nr:unnamed protein product [Periconia digitata]